MWLTLMVPIFLFLNLSFVEVAQNPGSATDSVEDYPPFWDRISGNIEEFPVKHNKIIVDIWNYLDRLRLYKIIMTQTNRYFQQFGPGDTGNVLWALTLMYGKLYKTDRFSDPSNISVCAYDARSPGCISVNSGWGGINFFVIVMNFFGAIESGLLNVSREVVLLSQGEHKPQFCYSLKECKASYPEAVAAANIFYQYLQSRRPLSTVGNISVYNTNEEKATQLMWSAHQAGIDNGLPKFIGRSSYSSESERRFTVDFLDTIQFCEAVIYPSYFKTSKEFLKGYPHRLLKSRDYVASTKDFTIREKALCTSVKLISTINKITGGWFLNIWKKVMSSSKISRALGRFIIDRLLLIPLFK